MCLKPIELFSCLLLLYIIVQTKKIPGLAQSVHHTFSEEPSADIILCVSPSSGETISFKLLYWDNKRIIHVVLASCWLQFEFQFAFRIPFLF